MVWLKFCFLLIEVVSSVNSKWQEFCGSFLEACLDPSVSMIGQVKPIKFAAKGFIHSPLYPLLQTADTSQSGTLEGEEFVQFYKALTKRAEVQEIFENFSADGQKLTLLEFVDFLREEQKEGDHASDLALELIDRYEPSESGKRSRVERHQTWAWGGGP